MTEPASYTKLLALTKQMLELAKHQEWECLALLEAERASLLAGISTKHEAQASAETDAIANLIREIQDCDKAILDYVVPWQEHAATLLSRLDPTP